jgi:hypothetical protein
MKNRYFCFYILSVLIINTLTYFPYIFLHNWNQGFPFAIFAGFLIVSIISIILLKVYNRFEGKCLIEINQQLFGKKIGDFFSLLFIIVCFSEGYLLFISTIVISRKIVLPTTSPYLISLAVLLVVGCCLLNTEKTILIIISFFTFIIFMVYPGIIAITFREIDLRLMEGVIRHSLKIPSLELVAFGAFFFAGIENLALYNVAFKKNKIKNALLIYIFIGIPLAFLTVLMPIGIWGDVAVKTLNLPTLITNDVIGVDLFVIERGLFIVFPIYFVISLIGVINYMYVSFGLLKKMITKPKYFKPTAVALFILLFFLSKNSESIDSLMGYARIWCVGWFFYLIIFSIVLYFFTKKAVKK